MFSARSQRLLGWLSYAFASEVFAVVSLSLFLPVCIEQFARDNGFLEPDRITRCIAVVGGNTAAPGASCSVKIGRAWINTTSFSLYVNSIALAAQAITVISMGSIADRATGRKPLLFTFAFTGAITAICFIFLPSTSPVWILCALLTICPTVCFGVSIVAMNAYLPSLARESPEVLEAKRELGNLTVVEPFLQIPDPFSTLPSRTPPSPRRDSDPADQKTYVRTLALATSRISSRGIASGYLAGIIVLVLTLIPVSRLHSSTYALRLAISLSGAWWLLFSIPAAIWLPGPSACTIVKEGTWRVPSEIRAAVDATRGDAPLVGNEAAATHVSTITSTAILFAKTTLHMPATSLVILGAITPAAGVVGALVCPALQRRCGWSNHTMLLSLTLLVSVIPVYGTLGFVPYFREKRAGGLQNATEMFIVGGYFVYGAVQSYARATFAALIPPGEEARWYGLFSIADKSGSFIGPLIVGLIADNTGNIRYGFFYLVGMIALAVPVLVSVDVERGRVSAKTYSEEREAVADSRT
ncbi:autophagy-related protein 22-like protein [Chiua virens]|nr:autophagy-related protein 22-like protein [Chiua virens]